MKKETEYSEIQKTIRKVFQDLQETIEELFSRLHQQGSLQGNSLIRIEGEEIKRQEVSQKVINNWKKDPRELSNLGRLSMFYSVIKCNRFFHT